MKNKPKKHHWVPQFYLKAFINNRGMLNVYNKSNNTTFETKTVNVAHENHFYTYGSDDSPHTDEQFQVERLLCSRYEGPQSLIHAAVLRGLKGRSRFLTDEIKRGLAQMVAVQLVRTPRGREMARAIAEQEARQPGVTMTADALLKLSQLEMLRDGGLVERITDTFFERQMRFFIVPQDALLWTSDVPVITGLGDPATGKITLTQSQGIGRPNFELHFALSPHLGLCFYHDRHLPGVHDGEAQIIQRDENYVENFNAMTLTNAERLVFASKHIVMDPL